MTTQDRMETPRPPRRLRKVAAIVFIAVLLVAVAITVAYYVLTVPVIPQEDLQRHFAQARSYLRSVAPERRAVGEELLALFDAMPSRPEELGGGDFDDEEVAAAESKWLADAGDFLRKIRALASGGPGAFDQETEAEAEDAPGWLVSLRRTVHLLILAAEKAARENRMAQWLADLRVICVLADTVEHRGSPVPRLVGATSRNAVCREILRRRRVLEEEMAADCMRLCEELESRLQPIADALWGEFLLAERTGKRGMGVSSFMDSLSRVRWKSAGLIVQVQLEFRKAVEREPHDALITLRDMEEILNEKRSDGNPVSLVWGTISAIYFGGIRTWYHKCVENIAALRGTRIALALACYKRTHGTYPDQLSALGPGFLPAVLLDPFTNQQFVYRTGDAGFVLYAVGHDQEDDGGHIDASLHTQYKPPEEPLLEGSQDSRDFIVVAEGEESSGVEDPAVEPKRTQ